MPRRGAYTKLGNKTSPPDLRPPSYQSPRSEAAKIAKTSKQTTSQGPSSSGLAHSRAKGRERGALSSVDREINIMEGFAMCSAQRVESSRTFDLALSLRG
ncbi:hypothetical protein CLCR_04451 [Cladophialophora carrionii]|uniref:Uncharacterized protein n=1 Tax=Cladophialophora carrionii TaxID=86049 RepID=A0A1C1CI71_9EURO|nr:hypothetical protein CLCR_04451 [Cladophialophora carrionii]